MHAYVFSGSEAFCGYCILVIRGAKPRSRRELVATCRSCRVAELKIGQAVSPGLTSVDTAVQFLNSTPSRDPVRRR